MGHHQNSRKGMILVTTMFVTFLAASSAPTPLYRIYQDHWHFGFGLMTVVFAIYALSLMLALLTLGSLSDYIGRKPVILMALVIEATAMMVFISATSVTWLIVARAVQGVATGMGSAALGAAILDRDRVRGAQINSVIPFGGMACGVALSTALVYGDLEALQSAYEVLLAAFCLQITAVFTLGETVSPRVSVAAVPFRPHIEVPEIARRAFLQSFPANIAVWGLSALYMSLLPSLLRDLASAPPALTGGGAVLVLTGSAFAFCLLANRLSPQVALLAGASAVTVGTACTLWGVEVSSVPVLLSGTAVAVSFGS